MPIVSICCITYNHENYIREALEGFLMQRTNFAFEIVISDDCSTDKTRDIVREYRLRYPNLIRDISPRKNIGVIENWKYVHLEAKGKYIAFCEGDDYWIDPYKLQKQVRYMEDNPLCSLCITDFYYQYDCDKKNLIGPAFASLNTFQPHSFIEHLKNAGYIAPMTWLYKRESFLKNLLDYSGITDGTFALALDLFKLSNVVYLTDVTAIYRVHNNSAANPMNIVKKMQYTKGVYEIQYNYAQKYECGVKIIDLLRFQNYTTSMLLALESGDCDFIDDAIRFYDSKGFYMKWFIESCKEYVYYKQRYNNILTSKAYKLGKFIIRPLSYIHKKFFSIFS